MFDGRVPDDFNLDAFISGEETPDVEPQVGPRRTNVPDDSVETFDLDGFISGEYRPEGARLGRGPRRGTEPPPPTADQVVSSVVGGEIGFFEAIANGLRRSLASSTATQALEVASGGAPFIGATDESIAATAEAFREVESIPEAEGMDVINRIASLDLPVTQLAPILLGAMLENPAASAELAASSAFQSLPAIIMSTMGAAVNPLVAAGGSFLGTQGVEEQAAFAAYLAEEGVDLTDEDSIRDALQDQDKIDRIRMRARKRGLGVGAVEAVFGGLTAGIGRLPIRPRVAGAAGAVLDPVGEALGEVGGQLAGGEEVSAGGALLEGFTSVGQSAVQGGLTGAVSAATRRGGQEADVTADPVDDGVSSFRQNDEEAFRDYVAFEIGAAFDTGSSDQVVQSARQIFLSITDQQQRGVITPQVAAEMRAIVDRTAKEALANEPESANESFEEEVAESEVETQQTEEEVLEQEAQEEGVEPEVAQPDPEPQTTEQDAVQEEGQEEGQEEEIDPDRISAEDIIEDGDRVFVDTDAGRVEITDPNDKRTLKSLRDNTRRLIENADTAQKEDAIRARSENKFNELVTKAADLMPPQPIPVQEEVVEDQVEDPSKGPIQNNVARLAESATNNGFQVGTIIELDGPDGNRYKYSIDSLTKTGRARLVPVDDGPEIKQSLTTGQVVAKNAIFDEDSQNPYVEEAEPVEPAISLPNEEEVDEAANKGPTLSNVNQLVNKEFVVGDIIEMNGDDGNRYFYRVDSLTPSGKPRVSPINGGPEMRGSMTSKKLIERDAILNEHAVNPYQPEPTEPAASPEENQPEVLGVTEQSAPIEEGPSDAELAAIEAELEQDFAEAVQNDPNQEDPVIDENQPVVITSQPEPVTEQADPAEALEYASVEVEDTVANRNAQKGLEELVANIDKYVDTPELKALYMSYLASMDTSGKKALIEEIAVADPIFGGERSLSKEKSAGYVHDALRSRIEAASDLGDTSAPLDPVPTSFSDIFASEPSELTGKIVEMNLSEDPESDRATFIITAADRDGITVEEPTTGITLDIGRSDVFKRAPILVEGDSTFNRAGQTIKAFSGSDTGPVNPPKQVTDNSELPTHLQILQFKNSEIDILLQEIGVGSMPPTTRKSWMEAAARAHSEGLDTVKALDVAYEINSSPRPVLDKEHVGMMLYAAKLINEKRVRLAELESKALHGDARVSAMERVNEIDRQLGVLGAAASVAGTEAGRSLAIRRFKLEGLEFGIDNVLREARAFSGGNLELKKEARLRELVHNLELAQRAVDVDESLEAGRQEQILREFVEKIVDKMAKEKPSESRNELKDQIFNLVREYNKDCS